MPNTNAALAVWDATLSVSKTTDDPQDIIAELRQIAKKFCFQRELGTGVAEYTTDDYDTDHSSASDNNSGDEWDSDDVSVCSTESSQSSQSSWSSFGSDFSNPDSDSCDSGTDSDEDDGYDHWQIHFSLIKRKRKSELLALLKANNLDYLSKAHFSPSSNNGLSNAVFYATKVDTRHPDHPQIYKDTDEALKYVPWQIRKIDHCLYSWQQEIIDRSQYCNNGRSINVIYDPKGAIGKSTLAMYMGCYGYGRMLPGFNDIQDIMAAVMCMPETSTYLVDMPRAQSKKQLASLYAGLENLRSGWVYDKRYVYKEKFIDSPNVWVFSNYLPDCDLLSRDRWVFWCIQNKELLLYPSFKKASDIPFPWKKDMLVDAWHCWRSAYLSELPDRGPCPTGDVNDEEQTD